MASISGMAANAIYDILVIDGGAIESDRQMFVQAAEDGISEYRFQGDLGFGGKFWNVNGKWYVNAYPEDEKRLRSRKIIVKINRQLTTLKSFLEDTE